MATYKLSKIVKGKSFQYTVTDESGNIISTRTSKNEYVACTVNGEFYFGRLDLIGQGYHGKLLNRAYLILTDPQKAWDKDARQVSLNPERWKAVNPFEEWLKWSRDWAIRRRLDLEKIAYL